MASANNGFTDKQKAAIFVRDRATCCFSGANLWLLDAPLRVGWQSDWVDHRKPKSRGGMADIENGVCASHTFNMKKRNNYSTPPHPRHIQLHPNRQPNPIRLHLIHEICCPLLFV